MTLAEFMSRLVNQGDFKFDQYEDIVQVEMPDESYRDIKEIFYLANPDRIIIRLVNNKLTIDNSTDKLHSMGG